MVKVRLLQVKSDEKESVDVRINRVLAQLPVHLQNADFVVLPELWTIHAFNLGAISENALTIDSAIFKQLSEITKAAGKWLHAGTFPIKHVDGTITNTAIVFDPAGHQHIIYSKIHLFGFEDGEQKYLVPGNKVVVAKTVLDETGISTCYDLRFPELYREQIKRGAKSFVISAGWPTIRVEHWTALLKARAIENQVFVIACAGRGTSAGVELAGQSMVINPLGEVIAVANIDDEFVDAEIDLALVDEWRSKFPVLGNIRDLHNL